MASGQAVLELRTVFTFLKSCKKRKREKKRLCNRDSMWLTKPKIFTIWPFIEKVC